MDIFSTLIGKSGLIWAFLIVGLALGLGMGINTKALKGKLTPFMVAMLIALLASGIVGAVTGGSKGFASLPLFAGLAVMGGSMLRDWCIVATAYGAKIAELKKGGVTAVIALFVGVIWSFVVGVALALAFGFRTPVDLTTIGAGAVTFIVGPVTGEGLGASSEVIAISVAAGVTKSIMAMILIPIMGRALHWKTPQQAMVIGGMAGTTSGTMAGLTALDPKLVPYGAMTATFYTGLGCLLCPSILYIIMVGIFG